MPTDTDTPAAAPVDAPERGPGLPTGGSLRSDSDLPAQRSSDALIDAAAAGEALRPSESDDLLGYFLTNGSLPGDNEPQSLTVKLGRGAHARDFACSVRPVEWSEWQDSRTRATDEKTGEFDAYVATSWNVARALVSPKLGPTVLRQQKEAETSGDGKIAGPNGSRIDAPTDAAELLRRMFKRQSGALLEIGAKVLEISKLQSDTSSVREVEAGKD